MKLRPSPIRKIYVALVATFSTVVFASALPAGGAAGWLLAAPLAAFFGVAAILTLVNLLPGSSFLELTAEGMVIRSLYQDVFFAWSDIQEFFPGLHAIGQEVRWKPAARYREQARTRNLASRFAAFKATLPDAYGYKADQLAALLNEWRLRSPGGADSALTTVFLAECGSKRRAEALARHFQAVPWASADGNIQSRCRTAVRQDGEANWWCVLSVGKLGWAPLDRAEANYRSIQITACQGFVQGRLKSAPAFRYAFLWETKADEVEELLRDQAHGYAVTYRRLFAGTPAEPFRVPLFVRALRLGFLLSEPLWRQMGAPAEFEALFPGCVRLPPAATLAWGGVQAPPPGVIEGTTLRLRLDPQAAEAQRQRGSALLLAGDFAGALAELEAAQKLNPFSDDTHLDKAATLYRLGRLPEALQACEQALRLRPDFAAAHHLRAGVLHAQGKPLEALSACAGALEHGAANADTHLLQADILREQGRFHEALLACQQALQRDPRSPAAHELQRQLQPVAQYQEGSALLESGQHESALRLFEAAARTLPQFYEAFHCQGLALGHLGRHEEALAAFAAALRVNPTFDQAHDNRDAALYNLGRFEEPLEIYQALLAAHPRYAHGWYRQGIILDGLGRHREAVRAFERALALRPDLATYHLSRGIALDRSGQPEQALAALNESLRLNPGSANAQNSRRVVTEKLGGVL